MERRSPDAKSHFANFINLYPAMKLITGRLGSGRYTKTTASIFELFQSRLEERVGRKASRYDTAALALYHPTMPNAKPLLLWLREFLQQDQAAQIIANQRFKDHLERRIKRALFVLKAPSNAEDAQWLAKQYTEIFGRKPVMESAQRPGSSRSRLEAGERVH